MPSDLYLRHAMTEIPHFHDGPTHASMPSCYELREPCRQKDVVTLQALEGMVAQGKAAKLTPTGATKVQFVDESLLRIRFKGAEIVTPVDIGCVSKSVLSRSSETE